MRRFTYTFVLVLAASLLGPRIVAAQTPPAQVQAGQAQDAQALRQEIDQLRRDFETRLAALEARLGALQGQPAPAAPPGGAAPSPATPSQPAAAQPSAQVPPGAEGAGGPSGSLPVYGSAVAASKVFNPDMAVIGDFLGAAGSNRVAADPALALHESEASFQAVVDPYARADFWAA